MSSLRWKYSFTQFSLTGVAQRKRAGLITPRTPDRNGLPVLSSNRTSASRHLEHVPEPVPETLYRCSSAAERLQHRLLPSLTL